VYVALVLSQEPTPQAITVVAVSHAPQWLASAAANSTLSLRTTEPLTINLCGSFAFASLVLASDTALGCAHSMNLLGNMQVRSQFSPSATLTLGRLYGDVVSVGGSADTITNTSAAPSAANLELRLQGGLLVRSLLLGTDAAPLRRIDLALERSSRSNPASIAMLPTAGMETSVEDIYVSGFSVVRLRASAEVVVRFRATPTDTVFVGEWIDVRELDVAGAARVSIEALNIGSLAAANEYNVTLGTTREQAQYIISCASDAVPTNLFT